MHIYKTLENGIVLAEYEPTMAAALAKMHNDSREQWGGGNVRTAAQVEEAMELNGYLNKYVAIDGEKIVAYCGFGRYFGDADAMYVGYLNAHPDYHGKKLGKELLLLCVARTIELGSPRLDLFTWPGNVKAVPLYKKCGFFWEDRDDTTHLVNFIPYILSSKLFADFFAAADWYADSKRVIETERDGTKVDKFDMLDYVWEHDGKRLEIGFERSGRRLRRIENDDFSIEMTADNHELPFGVSYNCKFAVKNKSGKPLDIKIKGKNDGNISFDFETAAAVTGETEFASPFSVGAIAMQQGKYLVHPCVLADVEINGVAAEFGLGINTQFPLSVDLNHQRHIAMPGVAHDCYINIKSALKQDCVVRFRLPDNDITTFADQTFELAIPALGAVSIKVRCTDKRIGHAALPIVYDITPTGQDAVRFESVLHLVNQGLEGAFAYEDKEVYCIVNGLWRLKLPKLDFDTGRGTFYTNNFKLEHAMLDYYGGTGFGPPQFGLPYDEEFERLPAAAVRMYQDAANMVLEADFESLRFPGAAATMKFALSAHGLLVASTRAYNNGDDPCEVKFIWPHNTPLDTNTIFAYDGAITRNDGGLLEGFDAIESDRLDENWAFDANPKMTRGVCWPPAFKLGSRYGNYLNFELDAGQLAKGETREMGEAVYAYGLFPNWAAFRDFAMQTYTAVPDDINVKKSLEVIVNGGNPVVWDAGAGVDVEVRKNRVEELEGCVAVFSDTSGSAYPLIEIEEVDDEIAFNTGKIRARKDGVEVLSVMLEFSSWEKEIKPALLIPRGEVKMDAVEGVHRVSNGIISFSAAEAFAESVYSLIYHGKQGDHEWLLSKYPTPGPHVWYNPFVGGFCTEFGELSEKQMLKEKRVIDFTECCDNFGNKWQGIKSVVAIEQYEKYKGVVQENYYLTLPGLPLICHFVKIHNNTGLFLDKWVSMQIFPELSDKLSDAFVDLTDTEGRKHRLRLGDDYQELEFKDMAKIYNLNLRDESMYILGNSKENNFDGSQQLYSCYTSDHARIANGESFTSRPLFVLLAEQRLQAEWFADVKNIRF